MLFSSGAVADRALQNGFMASRHGHFGAKGREGWSGHHEEAAADSLTCGLSKAPLRDFHKYPTDTLRKGWKPISRVAALS